MPLQQQQQQQQHQQQPVVPIDRGRLALEQPSTLVRTRTVINRSQTPLYCSEACRKKDLDAREILERGSSSDRLKSTESAQLATKTKTLGKEKHVSLGAHPAQINLAHASPPPPSSVLLSVPPNSRRAPNLRDFRAFDLGVTTLRIARSDSDTSSSATGTSFTASASAEQGSPEEE
ncbi:hypothetical protein DFH11DRAFT_1760432 [Phellopilus nigrolimitatus]|nr:hypothetical protein DFH11DRAFT_1760432 [Phellopilus nigrolimitatus]